MYPGLARIFIDNGYALAVHGSLARDLDLIAIPWIENPSTIDTVLEEVTSTYALKVIGEPEKRPNGRLAYTISVGFGDCAVDLSFMPRQSSNPCIGSCC